MKGRNLRPDLLFFLAAAKFVSLSGIESCSLTLELKFLQPNQFCGCFTKMSPKSVSQLVPTNSAELEVCRLSSVHATITGERHPSKTQLWQDSVDRGDGRTDGETLPPASSPSFQCKIKDNL